jgi:hypothetical protein
MIKFDSLLGLRSIFQEITLITNDTEVIDKNELAAKICRLLDRLIYMQTLNMSIRAELIEKLLSILPALSPETVSKIQKEAGNLTLLHRRRAGQERRKLSTYLAKDRRSGITDRRRRAQNASAGSGSG